MSLMLMNQQCILNGCIEAEAHINKGYWSLDEKVLIEYLKKLNYVFPLAVRVQIFINSFSIWL